MAAVPIPFSRTVSTRSVSTGRRQDEEGGDEEAEIWAALERLPTYDRVRTTILERAQSTRGERQPVQVKDVDLEQYIVTQLFRMNNPEVDNERFLSRLRKRIDDAGVEVPAIEIRYEEMKVQGQVYVGTRGLPTLTNTILNFFEMFMVSLGISKQKTRDLVILEGVSGILKAGRMTILLGPPGSGKTTFLHALAGMLDPHLKLEGTIEYNGHKLNEFEPRKTAAYISQDDLHAPELTVRETMDYSARFQGVGSRFDLLLEVTKSEKEKGILPDPDLDYFLKAISIEEYAHEIITAYVMKIMGLDICADTIVGDQMIRGISGGQRKRLTTAEMIVGPARALFMDEISTGLDSSTTYQVVKCIGQIASIFRATICISLLQPAPETYNLFDDVILLSGGHVIYHGPLEHVEEFFATCGFKCPKRKSIPDFLQEVTSPKDQEQYWADKSIPYQFVPIVTFEEKFKQFHVAQKMYQELETPYDKSKAHRASLSKDHWSLSSWDLLKIGFEKEILILKKNWIIPVFSITQTVVLGLLLSSLFFRTLMHHRNVVDAQKYAGALFFILNQVVFLGYAEITFTAIRFPVFHKLRELQFFPPWTWALCLFLVRLPFAILESFTALAVTYYIIGLAPSAGRFFRLWLILALANVMGSGLFRFLAGLCRTYVIASSVGGGALIVLFSLGGYIIPRTRIRKWWIWGYWALPLSYIQNGVVDNEFLDHRWTKPLPGEKETLGHHFIRGMGLFPYGYWYWMVCGILIVYIIIFNSCFALSITFMGAPQKTRAQLSEAQLAEQAAIRTGEGIEQFTKRSTSLPRSRTSSSLSRFRLSALSKLSSARRAQSLSLGRSNRKEGSGRLGNGAGESSVRQMSELPEDGVATSSRSPQRSSSSSENGTRSEPARGMILPFQPVAMCFKDVNYFVDMPAARQEEGVVEDRLQLLTGITGAFRPGVLTALVGVTGAGKSTLMDVLAGRKTKGYVEGDIRINGFPKVQDTFARIAGYCEQNDIHSPAVTVHESLIFSAWLRLDREIDDDMKRDFVQEVMDLVELAPLKDAIVGSPGESGLSTEQRKRLTIAVELVANPSIIFMDEPTSGLDARAAATVMRAVRNTVDTGRTVVCTIHQPSIDIFDSFDELILLKRGGRVIYHGPLGLHCVQLVEYFQSIQGVPHIREGVNPAAWMLEISTPGMEEKLGFDFADLYLNSDVYKRTRALVEELGIPPPGTADLSFPTLYAQPMWKQFTSCLWKQHWTYWRSPGYNLMRFLLSLFCAVFFGTVFYATGKKLESQSRLYSLMGSIFSSQMFYGVLTSTAIQPLVNASRTVFYRERSAHMYSEFPYAIAQCVIELPYVFASSALYSSISYTLIKMYWKADKFFWYLYFVFCSQITFSYWGMMTVSLTPTPQLATILAGCFYNIWSLFSGFVLPHPKFPVWWKWAYWLDPISYNIYGTLVSQFGDLDDVYTVAQGGSQMTVKQLLRKSYGFRHSFLWFVAWMSIMFPIVFAVVFVICIKFLNYQQR
ncbi:unnamed protein product [Calypogeia fissa]